MNTFDQFTDRARQTMDLAHEEARRYRHDYLGTEHLLLGLVRVNEGAAARALAALGLEEDRVREAFESLLGRGSGEVRGEIALTPRAKSALELALDEARQRYYGVKAAVDVAAQAPS